MNKIIFIPGMKGSKGDLHFYKKFFKDIIFFKYDTDYNKTIEEYARELKKFIKKLKLKPQEKVDIIGISGGGIIGLYYSRFLDRERVNSITTVCSPIKGSWLPKIFPKKLKGIQQLRKNTNFVKKLNLRRANKEFSYYCFFDPLVPGFSAKGENSKHSFFFLHWFVQFWKPIIKSIKLDLCTL